MFVEKLELFGFKSFAARTEVPFARGITAIVGPNGCGKSNLSDALRWVLGEQNARTLRGERIQDVIFKGTRTAKPLGFAEVVLNVSNDDGVLPLEYTQVSVARRVFRSGESEFSINKVPCRLKDIRDLFAGTGLGSHGYSVIERGMIDDVLSDKDESRRFLFEEAAGITKYKQRRRESERRLEGVEQDLTRIEDMIREIERGVRSLARQAGKVRRWRRLKEELDHHEVRTAWDRWRSLREKSASSESLHAARERERGDAQTALTLLETRRETLRLNLLELATRLDEAARGSEAAGRAVLEAREEIRVLEARVESWTDEEQDLAGRLQRSRARREELEAELGTLRPRLEAALAVLAGAEESAAAAASRRAEADRELREARIRLQSAQQLTLDLSAAHSGTQRDLEVKRERREAAARRRGGLEAHLQAFVERETQVAGDLRACEEAVAELDRERLERNTARDRHAWELEGARETLSGLQRRIGEGERARAALESRLAVLLEQRARHEGFDAAVRRMLDDRGAFPELAGVVGEEVRLRAGSETVGRAVLGEQVPWVLVRDEEAAVSLMGRLREAGLGGVTLFPLREAGIDPTRSAGEGAGEGARGAAGGRPGAGAPAPDPAILELFDVSELARPFLGWLATTTRAAGSFEEARALVRRAAVGTDAAGAGGATGAGFPARPGVTLLRAVSPDGDVADARSVFRVAGGETPAVEILRREQEIPQREAELAELEAGLAALRAEEEAGQARQGASAAALRETEERLSALERERGAKAEQRTGLRTEAAMLGEERLRLVREQEQLQAEIEELDGEIGRLSEASARTDADAGRARDDFETLRRQAEEAEQRRDERSREATEQEMEVVRLRSGLSAEESRRGALERESAEQARAIEEAVRRQEERSREAAEASARAADLRSGSGAREEAAGRLEAELLEIRRQHQGCQDEIFSLDAGIRTARERLDAVVQALHAEDVERVQTRGTADRLRERVLEDYNVDLATWEPPPDPIPRVPRRRRAARPASAGSGDGVPASAAGAPASAEGSADSAEGSADSADGSGASAASSTEAADGALGATAGGTAAPGAPGASTPGGSAAEGEGPLAEREDAGAEGDLDEDFDGEDLDGDEYEEEEFDDEDEAASELSGGPAGARAASADAALEPFVFTPEKRQERIAELRRAMGLMGNLNYLAEEEYAAGRERLDFHRKQATDLRQAREDLLEAIRRINETAGKMFQETFTSVQEHFLLTFDRLFPGGEASLTLQSGDPLEGDIEIAARPRGKRLESIRLLSSGERALTAIALLFALYLAKPSPVCLLDEVDAPLDDANLDRFLSLVRHFSARTQFICITHNKKTMEMADRLFGVTMEEPGISKIVSVHMDAGNVDFPAGVFPAGGAPAGNAPAGGAPGGSASGGGASGGGAPAGGAPRGGRPAGASPAGASPAGASPAGAPPAVAFRPTADPGDGPGGSA